MLWVGRPFIRTLALVGFDAHPNGLTLSLAWPHPSRVLLKKQKSLLLLSSRPLHRNRVAAPALPRHPPSRSDSRHPSSPPRLSTAARLPPSPAHSPSFARLPFCIMPAWSLLSLGDGIQQCGRDRAGMFALKEHVANVCFKCFR